MPAWNVLGGLMVASLASSAWCAPAVAQWAVAAELGADRFWGGSRETTPEHRSFRPYRPTTIGLGVHRRAGKLGLALRVRYASAGLALEGADAVAAVKGVITLYSVSPELVYRLARVGGGNELLFHGGPLLEVWSVTDEESQTRVGVQAALSLRVPLGGRFAGSFAAGGAVTPSPFAENQLGPEVERRTLWRRRAAAGLEYRL